MQAYLIVVAGSAAWLSMLLGQPGLYRAQSKVPLYLTLTFIAFLMLSTTVNQHLGYDLFGAPYIRLGAAEILGCIGIGLAMLSIDTKKLQTYIFAILSLVTIVSAPYSLITLHTLHRMPGLVSQPNIMALLLGCGFILGLEMIVHYPKYRTGIAALEVLMMTLLLYTETRAVIALTILIALIWIASKKKFMPRRYMIIILVVIMSLAFISHQFMPSRLTDSEYAVRSVSYRLHLQREAIKSSTKKPIAGYGPGNLADALDCIELDSSDLQKTCSEKRFFNSSHNIFLDRVLAVGWIGGLSYLAIFVYAIWSGFKSKKDERIFAYLLLLIGLYYLTNITHPLVELLVWILMLQCIYKPNRV